MTRRRRRRKRKGRDPKVCTAAERFIVGREMARKERRDEKVGREKGLTVSLSVLSIRSVTGYPSVRRHLFSIELNPFLLIFTSAIGPRYFPILGKNREETRDLLAPRSGRSNGLSKRAVTEFIHFTIRESSTLHRYSATSTRES